MKRREGEMKSLHVCNIANVAYGYCKILDEGGYAVDLRCHDIKHLMSQPEWYDLELDSRDFPDENDFSNNMAKFARYKRPSWYLSEDLLKAIRKRVQRTNPIRGLVMKGFGETLPGIGRHVFRGEAKKWLVPYYVALASFIYRLVLKRNGRGEASGREVEKGYRLPELPASIQDLCTCYFPHAQWLDLHYEGHEVVFAYAASPVYAMVNGQLPYIGVEIGTLRDFPYEKTDLGTLIGVAYKTADYVIITNADANILAHNIGIRRFSYCPHPLDEDVYCAGSGRSDLRKELMGKYHAEILAIAPARQNWEIKGNDKYIRAFAKFVSLGFNAVLVVPGWGQEIDRSLQLCRDLGVRDRIVMIRPMSEKVLAKYYQAADFVLDQFQLGVFGLITPKAMSCGKPVLTSYERNLHTWCFSEHPPVMACNEEGQILEAMLALSRSPEMKREIGEKSRAWILKHHSKKVIRGRLVEAMHLAKERFAEKRGLMPNGRWGKGVASSSLG
jgi:glycosyltransferase involved in cell wall biosynthesis